MPDVHYIQVHVKSHGSQRVECLFSIDRSLWSRPGWQDALTSAIVRAFEQYESGCNDGMERIAERLGLTVDQVQSIVDDVLLARALQSSGVLAAMRDHAIAKAKWAGRADRVGQGGPIGDSI